MTSHQELFKLAEELAEKASLSKSPEIIEPIAALRGAVSEISRSFSGSWSGYHSRVYYHNFQPPPPGHHFSQEWGLMDTFSDLGSTGNWEEYDFEFTKAHVLSLANNPDLAQAHAAASSANESFKSAKAEIASIIQNEIDSGSDKFLETLEAQLNELKPLSSFEVAENMNRGGRFMTRDTVVIGQGTQIPPHITIKAEYRSIEHSFAICHEASNIARKAASHIERKGKRAASNARIGTNVFIGHGRAMAWRDLKDFVQDRIGLPWDEFNRVPVAGVTNIARLSEMLDAAAIAFLVMTAEDERTDGTVQARMNVIHEAGLFQGRLGFTKAIIMVEEGCQEFSNISGLGQIHFPAGNISAVFEEVRRVLEREGLL